MSEKIVLDGRHNYRPSRALQLVLQDECALRMMVWIHGARADEIKVCPLLRTLIETYVEAGERGDLDGEIFRGVRWSTMTAKRARIVMGLKRVKVPRQTCTS